MQQGMIDACLRGFGVSLILLIVAAAIFFIANKSFIEKYKPILMGSMITFASVGVSSLLLMFFVSLP